MEDPSAFPTRTPGVVHAMSSDSWRLYDVVHAGGWSDQAMAAQVRKGELVGASVRGRVVRRSEASGGLEHIGLQPIFRHQAGH